MVPLQPRRMVGALHRLKYNKSGSSGEGWLVLQSASVAATRVALIAASFVSSIVVARALTVDERGRFGLLMATAGLGIQFGNFGLPSANTYLIARDRESLKGVAGNTVMFFFASAAFMAVVGLAAFQFIPGWDSLKGAAGGAAILVAVTGLAVILAQSLLTGVFRFGASNGVDALARGGAICGMLLLWYFGGTTATWFGCAMAISGGLAAIWGLKSGAIPVTLESGSSELAKEQMRIGVRAYITCVASFALGRLPIYVIESRAGLTGLAFLSQAQGIVDAMLVLPSALGTVLFPTLAANPDSNVRIRYTLRMGLVVMVLMCVAALAVTWSSPYILPILYGKAYSGSVPYLNTMLPGVVSLGVCSVVQNALGANGYPWAAAAAPIAGIAAASIALFLDRSAIGCGRAYSVGSIVMLTASTIGWWIHRHYAKPIEGHQNRRLR